MSSDPSSSSRLPSGAPTPAGGLRPWERSGPLEGYVRLSLRAETASSLFSAPLGPSADAVILPRLVLFGPQTNDQDARLVFLAGFAPEDRHSSATALEFLEAASNEPALAGGVVLDLFPVVNRRAGNLWSVALNDGHRSELALLEKELRRVPPHAVIAVRAGLAEHAVGEIRGVSLSTWLAGARSELLETRWLAPRDGEGRGSLGGLADDLPHQVLDLRLTLPAGPTLAGVRLLHAVTARIRELLAYAQYL